MPVEFIFLVIPPFLLSIVLHEYAHAYAAFLAGDDTANAYGRLTLNPIAHIDLFGTIILPALLIFSGWPALGYAKPVPVNPLKFKNSKWEVWVSAAGPGTNIFLLVVAALIIKLLFIFGLALQPGVFYITLMLYFFVFINTVLAVFNLIPIPPLDGSHILFYYLRRRPAGFDIAMFFRQYGIIIFFVFIAFIMLPQTNRLFGTFIFGLVSIVYKIFGIPPIL